MESKPGGTSFLSELKGGHRTIWGRVSEIISKKNAETVKSGDVLTVKHGQEVFIGSNPADAGYVTHEKGMKRRYVRLDHKDVDSIGLSQAAISISLMPDAEIPNIKRHGSNTVRIDYWDNGLSGYSNRPFLLSEGRSVPDNILRGGDDSGHPETISIYTERDWVVRLSRQKNLVFGQPIRYKVEVVEPKGKNGK